MQESKDRLYKTNPVASEEESKRRTMQISPFPNGHGTGHRGCKMDPHIHSLPTNEKKEREREKEKEKENKKEATKANYTESKGEERGGEEEGGSDANERDENEHKAQGGAMGNYENEGSHAHSIHQRMHNTLKTTTTTNTAPVRETRTRVHTCDMRKKKKERKG